MKRIIVNGYTYETNEDVAIGDVAVVPTVSWLMDVKGPTWQGPVMALTSDYDGPCTRVIAIVKMPKQKKRTKK